MSTSGTQLAELSGQSASNHSQHQEGSAEELIRLASIPVSTRNTILLHHQNTAAAAWKALLRCGNTAVFLAVFIINVVINSGNVWPQLSVANQSNHPSLLTPAG